MKFGEYQTATDETAVYPDAGEGTIESVTYAVLGLNGEAGEVAEQLKKALRDDNGRITESRLAAIKKEIGDVLWYLARTCTELDLDLQEVAEENIDKLTRRKAEGSLHGSGSDR